MSNAPTILGVTLGDPAGIGPEIVVKALASLSEERLERVRIFGHRSILEKTISQLGTRLPPPIALSTLATQSLSVIPGQPCETSAAAQVHALDAAMAEVLAGRLAGLATAPISKTWAARAGFAFPGHTEWLIDSLGAGAGAMMFAGPKLRVILATVHCGLSEVASQLSAEGLDRTFRLTARALRDDFGLGQPRVGVLGLNPHAGEDGRFGREELEFIGPAIAAANSASLGAQFVGPLVPDAAFRLDFDAFVAMYHDQGLIPVKLIDFDESVNTTIGLPIVRTSPDHGVAYDIAGRGTARATSMEASIRLAFDLMDQRAASAATAD